MREFILKRKKKTNKVLISLFLCFPGGFFQTKPHCISKSRPKKVSCQFVVTYIPWSESIFSRIFFFTGVLTVKKYEATTQWFKFPKMSGQAGDKSTLIVELNHSISFIIIIILLHCSKFETMASTRYFSNYSYVKKNCFLGVKVIHWISIWNRNASLAHIAVTLFMLHRTYTSCIFLSGARSTSIDLRTVTCVIIHWMDLVVNRVYSVYVSITWTVKS